MRKRKPVLRYEVFILGKTGEKPVGKPLSVHTGRCSKRTLERAVTSAQWQSYQGGGSYGVRFDWQIVATFRGGKQVKDRRGETA